MRIICAWCRRDMGTKPGGKPQDVSHSCCPECVVKLNADVLPSLELKAWRRVDAARQGA